MTILLNGDPVEAHDASNVAALIERYKLPPETILIEHNGLALHRREWKERRLAEGDRIEFIRVVAGG